MLNFGTFIDIWLDNQVDESVPFAGDVMLFEDGTPMLFEDGENMIYED